MDELHLRSWQQRALEKYQRARATTSFLLVATPGAGKTLVAAQIASLKRATDAQTKIVVVAPSRALCEQWASELHRVAAIEIRPQWDGGVLPSDVDGVGITYQGLATLQHSVRGLCGRYSVLGVLDEIHHLADERAWGDQARHALELARHGQLGLSGTLFRTDDRPIPFVRYENQVADADFEYSYGEALKTSPPEVRWVYFPALGGRVEWLDHRGEHQVAEAIENVPDARHREHLRARIAPDGGWLGGTLPDAHAQLQRLREFDPSAAGLVICETKWHAERTAARLAKLTGTVPVLLHSDIPEAHAKLRAFRNSTEPWLVAVRMVSEGVDIPRLRVGVFAAVVLTRLFFRQVVGRFVRARPGEEDATAWIYIPDTPKLVEYAGEIRKEVRAALVEGVAELADHERNGHEERVSAFTPLVSDRRFSQLHNVPDDVPADEAEVKRAEQYINQHPQTRGMDVVQAIMLLRAHERDASTPPAPPPVETKPKYETDAEKRRLIHALAGRINEAHGVEFSHIHSALNAAVKAPNRAACSSEQLDRQLEFAQRAVADINTLRHWL